MVQAKACLKIYSNQPSYCSKLSTDTEKTQFLVVRVKFDSSKAEFSNEWDFIQYSFFNWIDQIDQQVINKTPLRISSKKLKMLHGNTTSNIVVNQWFLTGHL